MCFYADVAHAHSGIRFERNAVCHWDVSLFYHSWYRSACRIIIKGFAVSVIALGYLRTLFSISLLDSFVAARLESSSFALRVRFAISSSLAYHRIALVMIFHLLRTWFPACCSLSLVNSYCCFIFLSQFGLLNFAADADDNSCPLYLLLCASCADW